MSESDEVLVQRFLNTPAQRRLVTAHRVNKRRVLRRLSVWAAGRGLLEASSADVVAWLASTGAHSRVSSQYLNMIHSFYQWAVHEGLINVAPTQPLRRGQQADRLTTADAKLVFSYTRDQDRRGLSPITITQSRRILCRLAASVDPRGLLAPTTFDIEAFLDSLSAGSGQRNPATRAWYLTMIHSFYLWAVDNELLEVAPTAKIRRPKKPKRLPRPISSDDLEMALAGAPPREAAMLLLAAFEGMRCIEISRLRREDVVDYDDPPVLIAFGKGSKDRIIPLHPEVLAALRLLPMPKSGAVFRHADGRPMNAQRVSQIGAACLRRAGAEATLHQLRHHFGTHMYRKTHDLLLVGALMGHENPATTAIYSRFDRAGARAAVESFHIRRSGNPALS